MGRFFILKCIVDYLFLPKSHMIMSSYSNNEKSVQNMCCNEGSKGLISINAVYKKFSSDTTLGYYTSK